MKKYVNGVEVELTTDEVSAFNLSQVGSDARALASKRKEMVCTPLQGILTLGETEWDKVLTYRDTATWQEKVIIDNASDWVRTSQNIDFFGYLLSYTDEQMDDLFTQAILVVV